LLANIVSFLLTALILFGISFLISKLFGPKGPGNPVKTASYIFSNKDNIAARNTPISLNYGRLRLGSNVTNAFILNFDLTSDFDLNSISQNASSGLSSAFI
jgi:predicted phage tail protein